MNCCSPAGAASTKKTEPEPAPQDTTTDAPSDKSPSDPDDMPDDADATTTDDADATTTDDADAATTDDADPVKTDADATVEDAVKDDDTGFGDLDVPAEDDILDLGDPTEDAVTDPADATITDDIPGELPTQDPDPLEDIFDDGADATDAADDAPRVADIPVQEGIDKPIEEDAAADDSPLEDLFDNTDDATEPATDEENLDDIFDGALKQNAQNNKLAKSSKIKTKVVSKKNRQPPIRLWVDNTGNYKTVGRLVKISPTHIRLFKDNDRFSTVSLRRLSSEDRLYVEKMKEQLGVESMQIFVKR